MNYEAVFVLALSSWLVWKLFCAFCISNPKEWVNWVGACDDETCDGCRKAFDGNPYLINEAPQPGSFECGKKCRHALQMTKPPKRKG